MEAVLSQCVRRLIHYSDMHKSRMSVHIYLPTLSECSVWTMPILVVHLEILKFTVNNIHNNMGKIITKLIVVAAYIPQHYFY